MARSLRGELLGYRLLRGHLSTEGVVTSGVVERIPAPATMPATVLTATAKCG